MSTPLKDPTAKLNQHGTLSKVKLIHRITEKDILANKHWKAWRDAEENEFAAPDSAITDLNEDDWYLTYAEYTLYDGTVLNGMVTDLYQRSHHRVFVNGKQFSIGDWDIVVPNEYQDLCAQLGKLAGDIYPTRYECSLKHWGKKVQGVLDIDRSV
jgi:hypothetical protein